MVRFPPAHPACREVLRILARVGCVVLCLSPMEVGAADRAPVRIGVRSNSFSALPILQATKAGHFAREGLAPEVRVYQDEQALAAVLAAGELDVAVLPTPLFFAIHLGTGDFSNRGRELITYQVALTNGSLLIVPAASDIRYSRQFRNQTIGVTHRLGMPWLLTDIYLEQSGLGPGEDTRWRVLAATRVREALRTREIGGAAVSGPTPVWLAEGGEARVMVPLYKLWMEHPAEVIVAARRFREDRPEDFRALSLATIRAAGELEIGRLPEGYGAWKGALQEAKAGFHPFPYLSGMRVILEEMRKRKLTPLNADLKAVAEATALTDACRAAMREVEFADVPPEDSRDERMIGCCYTSF